MKNRFIKSIVETARTIRTPLPWERGTPRTSMIERRKDAALPDRQRA